MEWIGSAKKNLGAPLLRSGGRPSGLGPRPTGPGPGGIALQRGLQSCLARGNRICPRQ
jgi:hypothetical protein